MTFDKELTKKVLKLLPAALGETVLHMGITVAKQYVGDQTLDIYNYMKSKKAQ